MMLKTLVTPMWLKSLDGRQLVCRLSRTLTLLNSQMMLRRALTRQNNSHGLWLSNRLMKISSPSLLFGVPSLSCPSANAVLAWYSVSIHNTDVIGTENRLKKMWNRIVYKTCKTCKMQKFAESQQYLNFACPVKTLKPRRKDKPMLRLSRVCWMRESRPLKLHQLRQLHLCQLLWTKMN